MAVHRRPRLQHLPVRVRVGRKRTGTPFPFFFYRAMRCISAVFAVMQCLSQWRSQEFDLGVYILTSHCNFKTYVNVPHVNKTVTDFFFGGGVYIPIYPPSLRPWSVRPSVTFVDHVKTNKHIFEIFSPSGSDTILVFLYQRGADIPTETPLTGASNARGV